jgi:hypothetical protein
MALHNFIRGHDLADSDFELDVQDNSVVRNNLVLVRVLLQGMRLIWVLWVMLLLLLWWIE